MRRLAALSVNAVCISRNGKRIYAYKASGYRGHLIKRSVEDTFDVCKHSMQLSHTSHRMEETWNA